MVARPDAISDKRPQLEDFLRRQAAARAWSQSNVEGYAQSWGKLMNIPPEVALNWLRRAKIREAPIDDDAVAGEQQDHRSLPPGWADQAEAQRGRYRRSLVLRGDHQGCGRVNQRGCRMTAAAC